MRWGALFLWALGLIWCVTDRHPLSPALEATYELTASRWRQGHAPYAELEAPVDPVGLWLYREAPHTARWIFLIWKGLGIGLLLAFLWVHESKEVPLRPFQWIGMGVMAGLYQALPYQVPLQVGEPAYALGLWMGLWRRWAFLRGILVGGLSLWHPAAIATLMLWVYQWWESKDEQRFRWSLLGLAWVILGVFALIKVMDGSEGLKAYSVYYLLGVWGIGAEMGGVLLGAAVAVFMGLVSVEMGWHPYRERHLFRQRLWALWGAGIAYPLWAQAFPAMGILTFRVRHMALAFVQGTLVLSFLIRGGFVGWAHMQKCQLSLPANACYWGVPTCYLRTEGPYGCNWTTPYDWGKATSKPDWASAYQRLGHPVWIYDAEGVFALYQYHLPWRLAPYEPVDTTLPGFLRVYRFVPEKARTPPWLKP